MSVATPDHLPAATVLRLFISPAMRALMAYVSRSLREPRKCFQ